MLSIINALVFDGISPEPFERVVTLDGGRIASLGDDPPQDAHVLDAAGRLVVPGLIDAHFHAYGISLDFFEIEASPLSYVTAKASRTFGRDTGSGVYHGARCGGRRRRSATRHRPRSACRTPIPIHRKGAQPDRRPRRRPSRAPGNHMLHGSHGEVVDGVDNLRVAVRERFRTGAHAIKIMASGGVVSPTDPLRVPQYSPEEIAAVCDEASRRGSYVAAHAYSPEAIHHAVGNGVRTIEHGNLLDAGAAALMAEHGAYLVPTLVTYDAMARRGAELGLAEVAQSKNVEVLEAGVGSIEIARNAGVRIGLGTDLMGDLEDDQLDEFRIRAKVESVADLLTSATSVNADIIGRPDLGRIEAGAVADLVLLGGNPFEDPSVLWSPDRTVIQAGEIVAGETA